MALPYSAMRLTPLEELLERFYQEISRNSTWTELTARFTDEQLQTILEFISASTRIMQQETAKLREGNPAAK